MITPRVTRCIPGTALVEILDAYQRSERGLPTYPELRALCDSPAGLGATSAIIIASQTGEITTLTAECERLAEVRNAAESVGDDPEFLDWLKAWSHEYENGNGEDISKVTKSLVAYLDSRAHAAPAKPEPAVPENILVPKWVGQFDTHQDWVRRAQRVLSVPEHMPKAICVDAMGRRCHIGADMRRANEEGAFPVRYFWECEFTAASVAQPLAPSGAVPDEMVSAALHILETRSLIDGAACGSDIAKGVSDAIAAALAALPLAGQDVRAVTEVIAMARRLADDGWACGSSIECEFETVEWIAKLRAALASPSPVNPKQEQ